MDRPAAPWYTMLHWQALLALGAGAAVGTFMPGVATAAGFLGDLFLRLLRMVIVPLVFTSLVSGVASLGDLRHVGRVGLRTLVYYTCTTAMAILVGLTLVNLIRPGEGLDLGAGTALPEGFATSHVTMTDLLLRIVPENVLQAMAGGDMLAVIFFALLFGLFLTRSSAKSAATVGELVDATLEVVQNLTMAVVRLAPVGIFALLAREVARSGLQVVVSLGPYFLTVGLGLLLHATVTLPLLLWVLGRQSPLPYVRSVLPALLTAFSTASSSATLPLTMDCAERRVGLPKGVTSFVLPLGATVNMDGTALYEAVAALTIAQMYGIGLDLKQQALVLLTSLLASVGAAGIPMAGLVMLVVVLEAVGLPLEGIATIIAVDRVLDMLRTSTNVWSDLVGAAVVARFEGKRVDAGSR